MAQFQREYFVFTDEAANDDKTLERRYGWAPRGCCARHTAPFIRGTRYTIEGSISLSHGLLAFQISEGPMNGTDFCDYVEDVLVNKFFSTLAGFRSMFRSFDSFTQTNSLDTKNGAVSRPKFHSHP
ncbi:hypothetical protein CcCBS67573_g10320 [Chytriomyces confervae]|uniref:Uncharacterized protein n=1 Tax=Chytriomyces confervae TaxID=246404 RepID=A0A507D4F3_9FUNG|nr:hypothetical protein CcCBS67573_g10320 [Chytriomyces confervae]